jgi:outer membrane protein TolC
MQKKNPQATALSRYLISGVAVVLLGLPTCRGTVPSARIRGDIDLPVPASAETPPRPERLSPDNGGGHYVVSARSVIPIAFNFQPDIKSSFQRFRSEEARYDFFYSSRDSLTPRLRVSNRIDESRASEAVTRQRDHTVELSVEKRFFDTTKLDFATGYATDAVDEDIGNHPFVSADLRYPLWASREKLERTSEDIFRRNELDDAQLSYIQTVRWRLQDVLNKFYRVRDLHRQVNHLTEWLGDLEAMLERMQSMDDRSSDDEQRLQAEIARVRSELRNQTGRYEIDVERFKGACGLPFNAEVEFRDEPFNPFEGVEHQDLLRLSIDTDPEIATLRNAMRNAEVQLDLAQRGTWDIALLLGGRSNIEGRGEDQGISDWSVSFGLDVSHVDLRVTDSLIRQAQANISRFAQAIAARENMIFVDTLEPLVRIDTLGASRDELADNLSRYEQDYQTGLAMYVRGTLNIDDLLKRRDELFDQQVQVSWLTYMVGANVAELCAATGKFFELLNGSPDQETSSGQG